MARGKGARKSHCHMEIHLNGRDKGIRVRAKRTESLLPLGVSAIAAIVGKRINTRDTALERSSNTLTEKQKRHLASVSSARHKQEHACKPSQAPTLCPARTTLIEGPKVDCTASNILRAFWSCDVKLNCEEWRIERGYFAAKDGVWPTWENARMASVPEVSRS